MVDFSRFNSLVELANFYHDEARCRRAVVESRWGVGDSQDIVCPYCGGHHCYTRKDGNFHCKHCDRVFSCKVGTIFENSKVYLFKWFSAMCLLTSHKKGVFSCQLARDIKVTQKTAWYMLQKIRYVFSQDDREKLSGVVECDEVYIGGRNKWKHFSKRQPHTQGKSVKTKTPIFGMIERTMIINDKGKPETMSVVRAMVVENCSERNLLPLINNYIEKDSFVFTDEAVSYNNVAWDDYRHFKCNHKVFQYVCEGGVYTNNIEGFWAYFRRMIVGCYHRISKEHMQKYLNEAVYRWNTRKQTSVDRFVDMFRRCVGLVVPHERIKMCVVN